MRGTDSARTFSANDPATGTQLAPSYHEAFPAEVERAAELAAEAFVSYRKQSGQARADFLRKIATEIENLGDALITRAQQETGLPEARMKGERARTCGQLRMFADLVEDGSWVDARIDHADPTRHPVPKPDTRSMLQGLGPVAVFGPANFPLAFAVAGGDTASALAAGCPVVVKAHSSHPGTSELVGFAVQRAVAASGLHEGVFSLLFGSGRAVGQALVQHHQIKAVGFTGSKKAGRELFNLASLRPEPIPFFGELSSINPVFLLPGAMEERSSQIAAGLHASATLGVGQFCTNPGIVVAEKNMVTATFARQFRDLMVNTKPGVMLNAGTRSAYCQGVSRLETHTEVRAMTVVKCDAGAGSAQAGAAFFRSDLSAFLSDPALGDEIFGPATLLLIHEGSEQLLAFARGLEGQLTATVHGTEKDIQEHAELLAVLETKVGRIVFNGFPTGVEVCASMVHGGPWPAATDSRFTSVGTGAIFRFARPVCYQSCPQAALPCELRDENPLGIQRLVDQSYEARVRRVAEQQVNGTASVK